MACFEVLDAFGECKGPVGQGSGHARSGVLYLEGGFVVVFNVSILHGRM